MTFQERVAFYQEVYGLTPDEATQRAADETRPADLEPLGPVASTAEEILAAYAPRD